MLNSFVVGDSLKVMRTMESESVDLVITSPPYNLRNSTGGCYKNNKVSRKWKNSKIVNTGYEGNTDDMPYDEYISWQKECLNEMYRLIKPTGAIYYNHKPRVQAGEWQSRWEIVADMKVRQCIIWKRAGGLNFNPGYYVPVHEYIFLIPKKDFKLSVEGMSLSDVWSITQESNNPHPAPFPERLVENILVGVPDAKIILDPFGGSGTVPVVARRFGKDFIYIDDVQSYAELAKLRLDERLF
jgi:modification methylase